MIATAPTPVPAATPATPAAIGFADIRPDQPYTFAEVAALFRRSRTVVYDWIKAKKIVPMANVRMILGAEILRFAGLSEPPRKSETRAERSRRAKADREAIRNL